MDRNQAAAELAARGEQERRRDLAEHIGIRPTHIASCPWCGSRDDAEILPADKPIVRCRECFEDHTRPHNPGHHVKVAWYYCFGCNLVYSGSEDEYHAEWERREERKAIAARPTPEPPVQMPEGWQSQSPGRRAAQLRHLVSEVAVAARPPEAKVIHKFHEDQAEFEAAREAQRRALSEESE